MEKVISLDDMRHSEMKEVQYYLCPICGAKFGLAQVDLGIETAMAEAVRWKFLEHLRKECSAKIETLTVRIDNGKANLN